MQSNDSVSQVMVKIPIGDKTTLLIGPKTGLIKMPQIGLTKQDSHDDMKESEDSLKKEALKRK